MSTGNFETWAGRILDIGPIYPFVGSEVFLFIVGLVFYVGWQVLQTRMETREYAEDLVRLGGRDGLTKVLKRDED